MAHIVKHKTRKLVLWQTHEALIVTTGSSIDLNFFKTIKLTFRYLDNTIRNPKDLCPFLVTHTENYEIFTLSYKQYLKKDI